VLALVPLVLMGGWTPLYMASKEGHPDVLRFLLEYGVDATVKTEDGSLPLHVAAARGHVEVARLLLERGTDASHATARKQDVWRRPRDMLNSYFSSMMQMRQRSPTRGRSDTAGYGVATGTGGTRSR